MRCTRLAANTGRKKIAISAPSHNFVGPYLIYYSVFFKIVSYVLTNTSYCLTYFLTYLCSLGPSPAKASVRPGLDAHRVCGDDDKM